MTAALPITDDELPVLFKGLEQQPLALAVSGGADSMALMHMVARWAAREDVRSAWAERSASCSAAGCDEDDQRPQSATRRTPPPHWLAGVSSADELQRSGGPPHVVVLTVDHGLRPEAAQEAAFVAREAAALGLPHQVLRWEAEKPSTGIQNAAREARRRLLLDAIAAERSRLIDTASRAGALRDGFNRSLVMAHHLEDQAETFLMRLARGSGLDGLGGMRSENWAASNSNSGRPSSSAVALLRPLLGVPKARLLATARGYGAKWIDDPSNNDERFERVRIRKVLQQLEPLGFSAEKIALSARRLAEAERSLRHLVEEWVAPPHLIEPNWLYGELEIRGPLFSDAYIGARTLRHMLRSYGGASRVPELAQLEAVFELARSVERRTACGGLTLGGCRIEFRGEGAKVVRVYREGAGEGLPVVTIQPGQTVDWDGARFRIVAGEGAAAAAEVRAFGTAGWAALRRQVPELAELKWPAAAVATLPVIARHGTIVAHPVIDHLLLSVGYQHSRSRHAWAGYAATLEPGFKASFNVVAW
ncbi:MAG: tRNA lysidine(34) synthetase TilS [Hyphomicrobiaceae bacterium]